MKRLLIDTTVLLDLTILELAEVSSEAFRDSMKLLSHVNNIVKRDRLLDHAKSECFRAVDVSAGCLHEMDRHAASVLVKGNRDFADLSSLREFWKSFEHLRRRLGAQLPLSTLPLIWDDTDMKNRLRYGHIDAHQLSVLVASSEHWLVTTDGDLEAKALELAPDRVLHVDDIIAD